MRNFDATRFPNTGHNGLVLCQNWTYNATPRSYRRRTASFDRTLTHSVAEKRSLPHSKRVCRASLVLSLQNTAELLNSDSLTQLGTNFGGWSLRCLKEVFELPFVGTDIHLFEHFPHRVSHPLNFAPLGHTGTGRSNSNGFHPQGGPTYFSDHLSPPGDEKANSKSFRNRACLLLQTKFLQFFDGGNSILAHHFDGCQHHHLVNTYLL